jgi:hypothetical protein
MEAAQISGKERKSGTGTLAGDLAEDKLCRGRHQLPDRRSEAKLSTSGEKMPRRGKPKPTEEKKRAAGKIFALSNSHRRTGKLGRSNPEKSRPVISNETRPLGLHTGGLRCSQRNQ